MSQLDEYAYQQIRDKKLSESICVAATAKVIKFDKEKMTVNVQPLSKHLERGKYESQPPILRIPVVCLRSGGFILRPWIEPGDIGIILYLDHDMDSTVTKGEEATPRTERNHAATDAVFLGGIVTGDYVVPDGIPDKAHVITKEDGTIYSAVTDETIMLKNRNSSIEITEDTIDVKTRRLNLEVSENIDLRSSDKIDLFAASSISLATAKDGFALKPNGSIEAAAESGIDFDSSGAFSVKSKDAITLSTDSTATMGAKGKIALSTEADMIAAAKNIDLEAGNGIDATAGTINTAAGTVNVKSPGAVHVDTDVLCDNDAVSLSHHTHMGVHGQTSEPVRDGA